MQSKRKNKKSVSDDGMDLDRLRSFMKLSVRQKLKCVEDLNKFLRAATPRANQLLWEQLRQEGY